MMKMKGIKTVAGRSRQLGRNWYLQLNYDKAEDRVWTNAFDDLGQNSRAVYHDKNIVNCGIIDEPTTMAEIREMVVNALEEEKLWSN